MTMQDSFSLKALFPSYDGKDVTWDRAVGDQIILSVFSIFFYIVGLVGNGNIIWLLGFRMTRKPFSIYVLNLATADFGALVILLSLHICHNILYFHESLEFPFVLNRVLLSLFLLISNIGQLLLAAISIDRWVSVLFPKWYQCHRSPVWSSIVCAFIWTPPFALYGVMLILFSEDFLLDYGTEVLVGHIVTTLSCLLPVIISTLTLILKVCLKSHPAQRGNLSKVILLILLSNLLFTILTYTFVIMLPQVPLGYGALWASLKSSINPLIYFLAGRQNGGKYQQRMSVILQRVFKEERNSRIGQPPCTQTSEL